VRGIPTLIILDAATGAVINPNGRDAILSDPEGKNYPWYPKTLAQLLLEGPLVDKTGKAMEAKEALEGKIKMIYFSAHWCPPCRYVSEHDYYQ
jgi:nucleoredoxin